MLKFDTLYNPLKADEAVSFDGVKSPRSTHVSAALSVAWILQTVKQICALPSSVVVVI